MIPTRSPESQFRTLRRATVAAWITLAALLSSWTASPAGAQLPPTSATAELQGNSGGALYVPGELLVKFRDQVSPEKRSAAARAEGAELLYAITSDGLVKVRLPADQSVRAVIDRWNARPDVEYAAPNLLARAFFTPNDSVIATFDRAWNLRAIHAYDAWDVVTGNPNIVLAIIDSGVAFEDYAIPSYELPHVKPGVTMYRQSPDLPGPFLPGWDFVNNDAHPNDDSGHGTSVATIAAGAANNVAGSAGIAFGVTILPVKVLDHSQNSRLEWIVQGIRFAADQGADIANLSLGFPPRSVLLGFGMTESELAHAFKPLRDAVNYAQSRGTILVAASGNFDAPEVSLPAAYPGVIAVGATGVDDKRASYSSYGRALDFMAPGGDFTDLNGDHVQDGVAVLSIKPYRHPESLANPDSFNVFFFFGTSGASPHAAGAVALLRSAGLRDQGQIEQVLRETSVNPFQSKPGFQLEYGHGLIQLDRAVREAVRGTASATRLLRSAAPERLRSENPARGVVRIAYRSQRDGPVHVRVFDARGRVVRSFEDRGAGTGERFLEWDGRAADGSRAASGVYWIRIETPGGAEVRKVAFLR